MKKYTAYYMYLIEWLTAMSIVRPLMSIPAQHMETRQSPTRSRGRCQIAHHFLPITCFLQGFQVCVGAVGTPSSLLREHNTNIPRREAVSEDTQQAEEWLHEKLEIHRSKAKARYYSRIQMLEGTLRPTGHFTIYPDHDSQSCIITETYNYKPCSVGTCLYASVHVFKHVA